MPSEFVLSGYHINNMLQAPPGEIKISLDLGMTAGSVVKTENEINFPDGQILSLSELKDTLKKRQPEDCFLVK